MVEPQAIIDEARTWLGTPWHHQQSLKGVGCDCVGLIKGTALALGYTVDPLQWKRFANYARTPNPNRIREGLAIWLEQATGRLQIGDVLFIAWREGLPMHLAFKSELNGRPAMIHAVWDHGKVVEHDFVDPWPDRVVSAWRLPGVRIL